ncbi:DUF2510 domain-containing protein [Luteimicrobium sp. NPDC057192]|uniref:DUF2510 domain-containing protein n=1 Tax=Luteimicrobium sp. NPDC057192 TaxID=3346042 RepID=UPI00363084E1
MTIPAPGWYPDPYRAGMLRWFDGHGWTEHVAPLPGGPQAVGDPYQAAPVAPSTAVPARKRLPDHVRALIVLGALAAVVLVGAVGAFVSRQLGEAWDRAVVSAQQQGASDGAGAPGAGTPADDWRVTCDDVRTEIMNHLGDYWEVPELQPSTLTNAEVVQDRQLTVEIPAPGKPAVWVLECRFDGAFDAGRVADVWADVMLYPDGGLEVRID